MAIINNLVMHVNGDNTIVYPNTVGEAVYMNILNHYTLPQALNDLRNNSVSRWEDISNKPFTTLRPSDFVVVDGQLRLVGSFTADWDTITNKPAVFPTSWSRISGKPGTFPTTWEDIEGIPSYMPSRWENIYNKPSYYNTEWNLIDNKPMYFNAEWFYTNNKPFNYINNKYFDVNELEFLEFNDADLIKIALLNAELNKNTYLFENYYNNGISPNNNQNTQELYIPYITYLESSTYNGKKGIQIGNQTYYYNQGIYTEATMPEYQILPPLDNNHNSPKFFRNMNFDSSSGGWNIDFGSNSWHSGAFVCFDVSKLGNCSYLFDSIEKISQGPYYKGNLYDVVIRGDNCLGNAYNFYRYFNYINISNTNGKNSFNLVITGNFYNDYVNFYEVINQGQYVYNISFINFSARGNVNLSRVVNIGYEYSPVVKYLNYIFDNINVYFTGYSSNANHLFFANQFDDRWKNLYIYNDSIISGSAYYDNTNGRSLRYHMLLGLFPLATVRFINCYKYRGWARLFNTGSTIYPYNRDNVSFYFDNCGWVTENMAFTAFIRNNDHPAYNEVKVWFNNLFFNNIRDDNQYYMYAAYGSYSTFTLMSSNINIYANEDNLRFTSSYDMQALFNNITCNHDVNVNFVATRFINVGATSDYYPFSILGMNTSTSSVNNVNYNFTNLNINTISIYTAANNISVNFNNCRINNLGLDAGQRIEKMAITGGGYELLNNIRYSGLVNNTYLDMNYPFSNATFYVHRSPGYDTNTTPTTMYLPVESLSVICDSGYYQMGLFNISFKNQKKYIYILGNTALDRNWQNDVILAKNLFNVNAENIPADFVRTTIANGFSIPNYNLFVYNGNYVSNNAYLITSWYPAASVPIEDFDATDINDTILYEGELTPNEDIVFVSNEWTTKRYNSYFNKLDNGLYLCIPDANELYLPATFGVTSFMVGSNYTYKNVYNQIKKKIDARYSVSGDQTLTEGLNWEGAANLASLYAGCGNLTSAVLPSTAINIDFAFQGCSNLETLPEIPTSVRTMNLTFSGCSSTTGTPFIGPYVEEANQTFAGCSTLNGTPIIASNNAVLLNTFRGCINLNGKVVVSQVKYMIQPFDGTNIEELVLEGTSPYSNGYYGSNILTNMNNLKRLSADANILSNAYGSDGAWRLNNLEYLKIINNDIPSEVYQDAEYGLNYNCIKLVYPPMFNQISVKQSYNGNCGPNLVLPPGCGFNGRNNGTSTSCYTMVGAAPFVYNIAVYGQGNYFYAYSSRTSGNFTYMYNLMMDGYSEKIPYASSQSVYLYAPPSLVFGVLPYKSTEETNYSYFNWNGYVGGTSNLLVPTTLDDYNNICMSAISGGYNGCPNLVYIVGPSGKFSRGQSYGQGFTYCAGGCPNLMYVIGGTYAPIVNVYSSFNGCSNLKKYFGQVMNVAYSFIGCPNIELENCRMDEIQYSFNGSCKNNFTTPVGGKINNIYSAFSGCGFSNINLTVSTLYSSFNGSSNLENLTIKVLDRSNQLSWQNNANFAYSFVGCGNLKNVNVTYITSANNSYYCLKDCFTGCLNLEYVDISDIQLLNNRHFNNYDVYGCNFGGCNSLHTLKIFDFPMMNSVSFRFCAGCGNLKNFEVTGDYDQVLSLNMAFENCFNLTTMNYVGNNVIDMWACFSNCYNLTECYCGPNVTILAMCYTNCRNITTANIGPSVQNLFGAFRGCVNLNRNIYINSPYINSNFNFYQMLEGDISERYNIFVIPDSDTNAAFYSLEGVTYGALFCNNNNIEEHPNIHWEMDYPNSCYYDTNSNVYVYYTILTQEGN